jgi:hypothetical protein
VEILMDFMLLEIIAKYGHSPWGVVSVTPSEELWLRACQAAEYRAPGDNTPMGMSYQAAVKVIESSPCHADVPAVYWDWLDKLQDKQFMDPGTAFKVRVFLVNYIEEHRTK